MTFTVRTDVPEVVSVALARGVDRAEQVLLQQIKKDTEQYVPMLTGSLNQRTRVIGNTIVYPGPYARYLYYGKVMVDVATGKGPMRFTDELGNEFIRWRKGAVLRPTERPLQYTTDFHPKAGAQWFERSKADNLPKWLRVAERAANNG